MGMMLLRVDTELDSPETLIQTIEDFFEKHNTQNNNPANKQSTLTNNNTPPKKYFCNNPECKKEIDKTVVAYCLFKDNNGNQKYNGKVYCRECQEAL